MISCLQIEGLTKSFGDRLLFADVTLGVYEGDKIGIIAPNGTGKSTLLSIIAGVEDADSGSVIFRNGLRVGYLTQTSAFLPDESVMEFVLRGVTSPHPEDEWTLPDRAASLLTGLGITDHNQVMSTMSGGQVKRAALAHVILDEPDLLLLDEPTNHLDVGVIEWLENYLSRSRATLLMVTHDRYFLDRVCNKIIEIDRGAVYTYKGNYDYYLTKRQERMENLTAELAKVRNLLRTEQEWMRRQPQARGSKAKYRIDNFHELKKKSQVDLSVRTVRLSGGGNYIGNKIFEAHSINKAYGDKVILKDWDYIFARYDKVGVVGDNGVGKTTLIRLLLGEEQPDSGRFEIGSTVRFGYYSQQGMTFDENMKVIDAVRRIAETVRINETTTLTASQFLSHFLFPPATQQSFVYKLSGGERRRLYLATVLMRSPNFLILDEPTNDLDIPTLAVLEDYLAMFKGCVLAVSHDRYFLDRVAEHLFVLDGDGKVRDFPGDYSTLRHCREQEAKERRNAGITPEQSNEPVREKPKTASKPKLTFKEKRELEELESLIPSLECQRKELEERMSSGTMSPDDLMMAGQEIQKIIEQTDEAEMRYLELLDKC